MLERYESKNETGCYGTITDVELDTGSFANGRFIPGKPRLRSKVVEISITLPRQNQWQDTVEAVRLSRMPTLNWAS